MKTINRRVFEAITGLIILGLTIGLTLVLLNIAHYWGYSYWWALLLSPDIIYRCKCLHSRNTLHCISNSQDSISPKRRRKHWLLVFYNKCDYLAMCHSYRVHLWAFFMCIFF